jgi:hypothetical protein
VSSNAISIKRSRIIATRFSEIPTRGIAIPSEFRLAISKLLLERYSASIFCSTCRVLDRVRIAIPLNDRTSSSANWHSFADTSTVHPCSPARTSKINFSPSRRRIKWASVYRSVDVSITRDSMHYSLASSSARLRFATRHGRYVSPRSMKGFDFRLHRVTCIRISIAPARRNAAGRL